MLSKDFKISGVKNYLEIQNYLNQLIQSYNAYRAQQSSQQFSAPSKACRLASPLISAWQFLHHSESIGPQSLQL
jgi:hypothetical protein